MNRAEILEIKEEEGKKIISVEIEDYDFLKIKAGKLKSIEYNLLSDSIITDKQRKLIYVLFKEISNYMGEDKDVVKELMKFRYCGEYKIKKYFSLSDITKEEATRLIEYTLDYCMKSDIGIKKSTHKMILSQVQKRNYMEVIYKKCFICGSNEGQLHHINTIGIGNERNEYITVGQPVMCLCQEHHTEIHRTGNQKFKEKYNTEDIILNNEMLELAHQNENYLHIKK